MGKDVGRENVLLEEPEPHESRLDRAGKLQYGTEGVRTASARSEAEAAVHGLARVNPAAREPPPD